MFELQLFLGFPVDSVYQQKLKLLSFPEKDLFIQKGDSLYLQEIESEGVVYLGKSLGVCVEIESLNPLQIHVYSLLKRLIPDYPYEEKPLLLLAIPKGS